MNLKVPRISRSLSPRRYLARKGLKSMDAGSGNDENELPDDHPKKLPLSARCSSKLASKFNSKADKPPSGIENVKLPPAKIDICPSLSNYQVHILKSTWNKVRTKMIAKDISGCFQAIERISSAASMSFNSVPKAPDDGSKLWQPKVIVDHTNNFIGLLDRIISNESGMEEELRRIGSAHVHLQEKYGLSVSEFEKFGEITAERFLLKDGIRQNNEATQTKFVKFLKKKNLAMPGVSLCQRLSIISKLDSNRR